VNELAKYMVKIGHDAYILPKGILPKTQKYTPYIYSNNELKLIFEQTDKCHFCSEVPHRHFVMPIFFRLLYSTAMRVSEARFLLVEDVDLVEGVITIINSKLNKHRLIPLSLEMLERLKNYYQKVHLFSASKSLFFPGYKDKPMTLLNIEKNFRKFLWQARISHAGRGKGPRIHDLRHTSAVHCLRRWVLDGKDLRAYLPILQAYLGHVSFKDTAYYLHLTAEMFPDITKKTEELLGNIIPKIGTYNEDN
jgi:integrase